MERTRESLQDKVFVCENRARLKGDITNLIKLQCFFKVSTSLSSTTSSRLKEERPHVQCLVRGSLLP